MKRYAARPFRYVRSRRPVRRPRPVASVYRKTVVYKRSRARPARRRYVRSRAYRPSYYRRRRPRRVQWIDPAQLEAAMEMEDRAAGTPSGHPLSGTARSIPVQGNDIAFDESFEAPMPPLNAGGGIASNSVQKRRRILKSVAAAILGQARANLAHEISQP